MTNGECNAVGLSAYGCLDFPRIAKISRLVPEAHWETNPGHMQSCHGFTDLVKLV